MRTTSALLFALGFLVTFTIGGFSGVFLGSVPFDSVVHGTYFIVAHLHYVLVGGTLMGALAGIYYWFPKMSGRLMNETLGKWSFVLFFVGVNGTFFPMHLLGLSGMPRRVPIYDQQFQDWNRLVSICSFIMTLGILLFVINIMLSISRGKKAGLNPWGARTLEWQVSSPPPYYNFAPIPVVYDRPYSYDKPLPYKLT
jgi:cytochrome c oxidase subunit 1